MAGALESVAALNHIPKRRWTWRHGSIAGRQQAIGFLIGHAIDDLPIDKTAKAIKGMLFAGFVVMGLLGALTMLIQSLIS